MRRPGRYWEERAQPGPRTYLRGGWRLVMEELQLLCHPSEYGRSRGRGQGRAERCSGENPPPKQCHSAP